MHKEETNTTVELINSCFDKMTELSQGKEYDFILDLSKASPPSVEVRHQIKARYQKIDPPIRSLMICVGSNYLMKVALQFVMPIVTIKETIKICKSPTQALSELKGRQ